MRWDIATRLSILCPHLLIVIDRNVFGFGLQVVYHFVTFTNFSFLHVKSEIYKCHKDLTLHVVVVQCSRRKLYVVDDCVFISTDGTIDHLKDIYFQPWWLWLLSFMGDWGLVSLIVFAPDFWASQPSPSLQDGDVIWLKDGDCIKIVAQQNVALQRNNIYISQGQTEIVLWHDLVRRRLAI